MRALAWIVVAAMVGLGCSDDAPPAGEWTIVREALPSALMSVWGTSASDVWAVGADVPEDSEGPLVLHWDGTSWTSLATGTTGDLWWVFGFPGGPVFMGGQRGQILRYENGTFTALATPGTQTVFGIWGASPDDMWAVGADDGGQSGGFAWRLQGDTWVNAAGLPANAATRAVWKVHGNSADDVWLVGTSGLVVHWNGTSFEEAALGSTSLFTVHCDGGRCVAVGGFASGVIFEHDGAGWRDRSAPSDPPLSGVCVTSRTGYSVGDFGTVLERADDGSWSAIDPVPTNETLHAIWIDPEGGVWTVGGRVRAAPLRNGVLAYRGSALR